MWTREAFCSTFSHFMRGLTRMNTYFVLGYLFVNLLLQNCCSQGKSYFSFPCIYLETFLIDLTAKLTVYYNFILQYYWLIWFINQRALYNHALSIVRRPACHHWHRHHLYTPLVATDLNIQILYLVHMCTYVPDICTSNI